MSDNHRPHPLFFFMTAAVLVGLLAGLIAAAYALILQTGVI